MERSERPQQWKAVAFGECQIEDEDVRTGAGDEIERFVVGGGFAYDFEAVNVIEHEPETFSDEMVVVDERDSDRPPPLPRWPPRSNI
jgi:hypothetical protein